MINSLCYGSFQHDANAVICDPELSSQLKSASYTALNKMMGEIQDEVPVLMSGAGHDAMAMSHLTKVHSLFALTYDFVIACEFCSPHGNGSHHFGTGWDVICPLSGRHKSLPRGTCIGRRCLDGGFSYTSISRDPHVNYNVQQNLCTVNRFPSINPPQWQPLNCTLSALFL